MQSRTKLKEYDDASYQKKFKDTEVICLLNSAAVSLKRKLYRDALDSCDKVLSIDNKNVKAMFRRGQALRGLNDYEGALKELKRALSVEKNDKTIKTEIDSLKKEMDKYLKLEKVVCQKMFQK
ncbi:hypothetical protein C0J52_05626 [Blattella germanica]|nr:hypothetical protein C0J52_05626 [Blattella germanica]